MTERNGRRALGVGIRGRGPAAGRRGEYPIVFLHAFPLDSRMWAPLADVLEDRGVTCHAFDHPGYGVTGPWPDVAPSLDAIADAAVETLRDGIGATRAAWVGCSMGGYVALAIADRHPDAVAGLGLVDTRCRADSETTRRGRLAAAVEIEALDAIPDPRASAEALVGTEGAARESLVAEVASWIGESSTAAFAWGQRAMADRPDRSAVLESLARPVAVVWGDRDGLAPKEEAEEIARRAGTVVRVVPGVGHLAPIENPQAVADELGSILPQRLGL